MVQALYRPRVRRVVTSMPIVARFHDVPNRRPAQPAESLSLHVVRPCEANPRPANRSLANLRNRGMSVPEKPMPEEGESDRAKAKSGGAEVRVVPKDGGSEVVVRVESAPRGSWMVRLLGMALVVSVIINLSMFAAYNDYFSDAQPPLERYRSGSRTASGRIAVIEISGTIMPPYTDRWLRMIKQAREDDDVRGVLLVVDSPGGLVADSHEIYHALEELRKTTEKPVVVSMRRIAASGGLYVAMAAGPDGRIFAEPTAWTGSIGVIVPHYDMTKLGEKIGVAGTHPALKTGPLKDSLSPLRPLSEQDIEVWQAILDDSFQRFLGVIADNRDNLDKAEVEALATGQVYTADQALANGLVDELGFEEQALAHLKEKIGNDDLRVVTYDWNETLMEVLLGSAKSSRVENRWQDMMESTVPRAMYYCSWAPFYGGR